MEKRLPTEPEKLGLLIFHADNPHRLYNELAAQEGCWRTPRLWTEACNWFDSMEFNDATIPPPPDTAISGYWLDNVAVTDPPAEPCPICNDTQENCPACPPADDAQYMRAWRAGAFDDELEAAFYVGYERLLEGAE